MTYLLINPAGPGAGGVRSYSTYAMRVLSNEKDVVLFSNEANESDVDFRKTVYSFVNSNFDPSDVVIEAPDVRACTMLLDRRWRVHIRLHCPLGILQKRAGQEIDEACFSDELGVVARASIVSSPTYAMVNEVSAHLPLAGYVVNKNPIAVDRARYANTEKDIDVLFMGRLTLRKGIDTVRSIAQSLSSQYRVAVISKGAAEFNSNFPGLFLCRERITDDSRFDIVARAKVVIVPSMFENCSMTILESLALGARVVAWAVGGNAEFPSSMVRTVTYGDTAAFIHSVREAIHANPLTELETSSAINLINTDYLSGFQSVRRRFVDAAWSPYRSPPNALSQPQRLADKLRQRLREALAAIF